METDSVAGEDIASIYQQLLNTPARAHPTSNHAFATFVEELRMGGQIPEK